MSPSCMGCMARGGECVRGSCGARCSHLKIYSFVVGGVVLWVYKLEGPESFISDAKLWSQIVKYLGVQSKIWDCMPQYRYVLIERLGIR